MPRRPLLAWCGLILTLALPLVAADESEEPPAPFESGSGRLDVEGRTAPLPWARTVFGPLVALQPVQAALGGELRIGPLAESHEIEIGGTVFRFGPGAGAVTADEEIQDLPQPPQRRPEGLYVPLELLDAVWGRTEGWEFHWRDETRALEVRRRELRQLPVSIDMVHLQGVTTLVMQFPATPRYQVEKNPGEVLVTLSGDQVTAGPMGALRRDALVRGIEIDSQSIRVKLSRNAAAEEYTLSDPFRIVFDVFPERRAAVPPPGAPATGQTPEKFDRPRRRPGVHTVVLDPGHGGRATGAIGPSGVTEKDLALSLARSLAAELERRLPVEVLLTREDDRELDLAERAAVANENKADLFLSLHLNSSFGASARGAETYFAALEASDERAARAAAAENADLGAGDGGGDPLYDLQLILWDLAQSHHLAESQRVAGIIQEELNSALGIKNRGVKQAPFGVLMRAAMPAVLVEVGFLSNPEEEKRLQDSAYRRQLIDALVRAVSRYRAGRATGRSAPATEEAVR